MKDTKKILLLLSACVLLFGDCSKVIEESKNEKLYLGQKPPGTNPQIFIPGIVSTTEYFELSNTISPDGKDAIMVVRWENEILKHPEVEPLFNKYSGFEPHVSLDGEQIYFTRFAPPPVGMNQNENLSPRDMEAQMVNIWVMNKVGSAWGEPEYCVNGMYVTTSNSKTIYTTDIREKSEGICKYRLINGKYPEREYLTGGVNSPFPGAHPCIAPDEIYIVFDSKRSDDPNNADLFVCFFRATLSPDGKVLFYQSKGDIYWVNTKLIEDLKTKTIVSVKNAFNNFRK